MLLVVPHQVQGLWDGHALYENEGEGQEGLARRLGSGYGAGSVWYGWELKLSWLVDNQSKFFVEGSQGQGMVVSDMLTQDGE